MFRYIRFVEYALVLWHFSCFNSTRYMPDRFQIDCSPPTRNSTPPQSHAHNWLVSPPLGDIGPARHHSVATFGSRSLQGRRFSGNDGRRVGVVNLKFSISTECNTYGHKHFLAFYAVKNGVSSKLFNCVCPQSDPSVVPPRNVLYDGLDTMLLKP